ncbi:hypothetical protein QFC24_004587 [Naganishia onofrii]|uniref:Uncharacterized protein n=1 Tax=Naganishia onofrii TaxID=1851511 RepID=A0ACC2XD74_9TREE|nr:hypothetical protein QFC24_004587 [Naganishia onofrii]
MTSSANRPIGLQSWYGCPSLTLFANNSTLYAKTCSKFWDEYGSSLEQRLGQDGEHDSSSVRAESSYLVAFTADGSGRKERDQPAYEEVSSFLEQGCKEALQEDELARANQAEELTKAWRELIEPLHGKLRCDTHVAQRESPNGAEMRNPTQVLGRRSLSPSGDELPHPGSFGAKLAQRMQRETKNRNLEAWWANRKKQ